MTQEGDNRWPHLPVCLCFIFDALQLQPGSAYPWLLLPFNYLVAEPLFFHLDSVAGYLEGRRGVAGVQSSPA